MKISGFFFFGGGNHILGFGMKCCAFKILRKFSGVLGKTLFQVCYSALNILK